mgnify:CR=1 FL=1
MSLILSCVVDRDPRFLMQAWTLLLSLQDAGVRPDADTRIVIHAAGQDPAAPRFDVLRALGAEIARIARARYREGVADYLEVLDAERNLFSAEQQLLATRRAWLQNRATLFVSLGGGHSTRELGN